MEDKICPCGGELMLAKRRFCLGGDGWDLLSSVLLSDNMMVDIYVCKVCGKVELYARPEEINTEKLRTILCPECGTEHDFYEPSCPKCGHKYSGKDFKQPKDKKKSKKPDWEF